MVCENSQGKNGLYLSWLEKIAHNNKVVGSIPARPTKI